MNTKEEKEYIKLLLDKFWRDDYPDNNEGISQSKMDLQKVEAYIDRLYYYSQLSDQLLTALLDKVLNWTNPFDSVCLTRDEILNNHSTYIVDYDEYHNAVVHKDWSSGSDDKTN